MKLLWSIISLIGIFLMSRYHATHIQGCTESGAHTHKVAPANTSPSKTQTDLITNEPLLFNWSKSEVASNAGWNNLRDSLRSNIPNGSVLEIVGNYYEDEKYTNDAFENLGLERASLVRELFKPYFDNIEDIHLGSSLLNGSVNDKSKAFEAVDFKYKVYNDNVKEIATGTLIYFPYGSTSKKDRTNIDRYLSTLAGSLNTNNQKAKIIGHTDSESSREFNKRLGLKRANQIKDELVALGVDPSKLVVASEGEDSPISDKDESLNRRVEVQILK